MPKPRIADSRRGNRILIADDTAGGRALLSEILHADGHAVMEAEDSAQLIRFTRSFNPDLVILDLQMKSVDAYVVAEQLRRIKCPEPLLFLGLSPAATQTFPERIAEAGFSAYLVKPISPFELRSCVSVLLATKR